MKIIQKATPNQGSRNGWRPDMIICHITDGSYTGAIAWHCNPDSGVSSHFIVSQNGEVTQLVPLEKMSWCNGTTTTGDSRDCKYSTNELVRQRKTNANYYTISIECEGYYSQNKGALTEIQLKTLAELIQYIRAEIKKIYDLNIPLDRLHLAGHNELNPNTRQNCPGQNFQWNELINILNTDEKPKKPFYKVQIGSFRVRANALAIQQSLELKGYSSEIISDDGIYKVQVGEFSSKEQANTLLTQLKAKGINGILNQS